MEKQKEQVVFHTFHSQIGQPEFSHRLSVFFGLTGRSRIRCQTEEYTLEPGGLFVVNPFELFQTECTENAGMVCMQISRNLLNLSGWAPQTACFCYAPGEDKKENHQKIRRLLASVFRDYFQDETKNASTIAANTLQLIDILKNQFGVSTVKTVGNKKEENLYRIKRIMDYIHGHWDENISLRDLAARENLSESYLSRFLMKNLNMTFTRYVVNLRITHGAAALRNTDDSVTRISYECGFKNASAFIESFRQRYNMTPGQYRKQMVKRTDPPREIQEQEGFSYLLSYAEDKNQEEIAYAVRRVTLAADGQGKALCHTWKNLLNAGYAGNILTAAVQNQIRQVQKEIGFRYIRFHGVLDQSMYIYQGYNEAGIQCNFTFYDMVMDFLREIDLTPFLEFSFLPPQLAGEQKSIFDNGAVTAACSDCEKLGELVEAIIRHSMERYGREKVLQWRFTTVQINYVFFGCMTMEEYFELYLTVYRAVKRVDSRLQFGGPGAIASVVWDPAGFRRFMEFAQENNCLPDFFSFQCYPHKFVTGDREFMDYTISQKQIPSVLSEDPDFLCHFLDDLKVIFQEYQTQKSLVLEEWNSTLWQRDLSNDTCYKAVWLVKNVCENYDRTEGFGYWLLTDFLDERADFTSVYHGGYGLMTYQGIPKSGYLALGLLNRLGDELVDAGEGWFFTRSGMEYQLLLYNYCHYDNIYRHRYRKLKKPEEAYTVFEQGEIIRCRISWNGLPKGKYQVEEYEITRDRGSSFDQWIKEGAYPAPFPEQCKRLQLGAVPGYRTKTVETDQNYYEETELYPLEVKMILIKRID